MATFPLPAFEQRLVVRNTFLEVTCDQEEFERNNVQRRSRAFTDFCVRPDTDSRAGIRSETETSGGQQSDEASTSAGARTRCSTIASDGFHEESEESLEATAAALVASAERLEREARDAKIAAASVRAAASGVDMAARTTVMFRNLPKALTQEALLEVLDGRDFATLYNFAYLPVDFQKMVNFGYAVVDFATHEAAADAMRRFDGFTGWPMPGRKACAMVWSVPCQGLEAQVERYRDSPLMHPDVAEEFRPMLFSCGVKTAFPPPTKELKAPPRLPKNSAAQTKRHARKANTLGAPSSASWS